MIRFKQIGAGLLLLGLAGPSAAATIMPSPGAGEQWWADIAAIASDANQGRLTGSPGYGRAADYVIARFKAQGLEPAGSNGYLQPVAFEQQTVDQQASKAELRTGKDAVTPIMVGDDMLISAGTSPRAKAVNAPLVFIGYGLHLPDQNYDDFSGIDLKGKIAVVLSGGPDTISGPAKSNARFERTALLAKYGAVGVISLTTPHQVEIPWPRAKLLAHAPGMYLADAKLRDAPDGFFIASLDPEKSQLLFAGTPHNFAELSALADASKSVPRFELPLRLSASVIARRERLTSPNLVAKLPGSDAKLAGEYVAVSAHLDHLGIGEPVNGDAIYNGAMDDASGVAAVLDIAHLLKTQARPRRSVLFVIFTAEEKGLLGSHYFASRPTVAKSAIVADLNFDMPLPLWPLKTVYAPGQDESTLGADADAVAAAQGLAMVPDPLPDRNVFIRTDQFSFVREGIPALAFKFGFAKDTAQFQIEHDWRANRYHAPSDDLAQPGVLKDEAVKLDALVAAIAERVANAGSRPAWRADSIFRPKLMQ